VSIGEFEGRVALVTGASRGIGRDIALGLSDAGARVAVLARTATQLDEVACEIGERGATALALGTSPDSHHPDPEIKVTTEETDMAVKLGLLAQLQAKPGKGEELGAFLQSGRELALAEQGTVTWYAFKIDDTHYGIFDTFETEDARQAHINGEIPKALTQVAGELLASDPDIRPVDIIAVK